MRAIFLVLLCTMAFVRTDYFEDAIRDVRVQSDETDDLSSVAEVYPRFISDVDINRRRRGSEMEHLINNARIHRRAKKSKRRLRQKHQKLEDASRREERHRKTRRRIHHRNSIEQLEKPNLRTEEEVKLSDNDLTTCILIEDDVTEATGSEITTSGGSTSEEESSSDTDLTLEFTTASTPETSDSDVHSSDEPTTLFSEDSSSSLPDEMSSEDSTSVSPEEPLLSSEESPSSTEEPLMPSFEETSSSDEPSAEDTTTEISQSTIATPEQTTFKFETTPAVSLTTQSSEHTQKPVLGEGPESDLGTKIFNIKLACKVEKPKDGSELQKVYQCYFGSSDLVSFYMPSVQNSIETQNVADPFPTISSEILSGNHTWRLIEATGVRARIIEKTTDKNKPAEGRRRRKARRKIKGQNLHKRRLRKRKLRRTS